MQERIKLQEQGSNWKKLKAWKRNARSRRRASRIKSCYTTFGRSPRNCSCIAHWRRWNPSSTGLVAGMSFYTTFYGTRRAHGRNTRNVVWHDILPFYTTFLEATVYISRLCARSGGILLFFTRRRTKPRTNRRRTADEHKQVDSINFHWLNIRLLIEIETVKQFDSGFLIWLNNLLIHYL